MSTSWRTRRARGTLKRTVQHLLDLQGNREVLPPRTVEKAKTLGFGANAPGPWPSRAR